MRVVTGGVIFAIGLTWVTGAAAAERDHLLCYKAKSTRKVCAPGQTNAGDPCKKDENCNPGGDDACVKVGKFPKDLYVRLTDDDISGSVGEDKTFRVKKVKHLCVPVDKNGEGLTDAGTNWVNYQVKQAKRSCDGGANDGMACKRSFEDCVGATCLDIDKLDKKNLDNKNIRMAGQFETLRVDANKVTYLMVPASRCQGNDLGCPDPVPTGEEHYKCYQAKVSRKMCALGAPNATEACRKDEDCGGVPDSCIKLEKPLKGLSAYADEPGTLVAGPNGPRAFDVKKVTDFCKAVAKTSLPLPGSTEGPVESAARLLCYKSKASKGQCDATSPENALGPCKKEENCGGVKKVTTFCDVQDKFDKKDPSHAGFYVNDQFDPDPESAVDHHRLDLIKEDLVCIPACELDALDGSSFSSTVLRATSLSIPSTGHPGDGVDVDGLATCQPAGSCSGGIDNSLGVISGFIPDLNTALQDAVTDGGINILIELDEFANGSQTARGSMGELASPAGCSDINDGGQVCSYLIPADGVDPRTCNGGGAFKLDVSVSNLPGAATVSGGGAGSDFTFSLPFTGADLAVTARQVKVQATVASDGTTASGALGGAVVQRELKEAISSLPEGICDGGSNNGNACLPAPDCSMAASASCGMSGDAHGCPGGGTCDCLFLGGFLGPCGVAPLIDALTQRDIDSDGVKTCEGGNNNGEPCTVDGDCPDSLSPPLIGCDQLDAISLGLKFTGIDAAITGVEVE